MYAFAFEWNPVVQSLLIKCALIAGIIAVALLVPMFVLRRPRKVFPKFGLGLVAFVIAFGALFVPPYLKGPELSEKKVKQLITDELERLGAPGEDYEQLFGTEPSPVETGEVVPGTVVATQVFRRELPIELGGNAGQFVQTGHVSVNRKTGAVSSGVSEFPQFPSCEKVSALAGANSDAPGEVIAAPMRFVPDVNPALPFEPPEVKAGSGLVVTNYRVLQINHPGEFPQLKSYLEGLGTVLDTSELGSDEAAIRERVREIVKRDNKTAVFIFGNADVVPFKKRVNPLYGVKKDKDIIFGDDYYGDLDDDPLMLPDIDVGRVPDDPAIVRNRSSALYLPELSALPLQRMELCSLSNFLRPSSALLVEQINPAAEDDNIFWSLPHDRTDVPVDFYRDRSLLIVLHGALSSKWSHVYWGEDHDEEDDENDPEGFHAEMARPAEFVWSAACYGGHVVGKTAENSIALAFLAQGTRGFVGFTGTHWSNTTTLSSCGQRLCKLFLDHIKEGYPPSSAFRLAKHAFAENLQDKQEKKVLVEAVYYGIPALEPVEIRKAPPPEPPVTPTSIATVAGAQPNEPPALFTTFGTPKLEPAGWVIPQGASAGGNARVGGGTLQLRSYGSPPEQPVAVLTSPAAQPFIGDWTVAVRVPHFRFRGSGRYGLQFAMTNAGGSVVAQHGLGFDDDWGDGLWQAIFGQGANLQREPLQKFTRALTMVIRKTGDLISFILNQRELTSVRLGGPASDPLTFQISHSWTEGAKAEVDIDYVYLFGERGEPADEPAPQPATGSDEPRPQPSPRALVDRYFDAYRDEEPMAVKALLHPDSDLHDSYDLATLKEIFAASDIDRTILEFMEVSSDTQSAELYVLARNEACPKAVKTVTSFDFTLRKVDGGWLIDDIVGRDVRGFTPPDVDDGKDAEDVAGARDAVVDFFDAYQAESGERIAALFHPDSKMLSALDKQEMGEDFANFDYEFKVLDTDIRAGEEPGTATVRARVHGRQTTPDGEVNDDSTKVLAFDLKKSGERWLIDMFREADGGMLEP